MFEGLKNLGDLNGLLQKAREMQEQIKKTQDELASKQITAEAGGGMVRATVNGRLELLFLKIDKTKIDVNDIEMLEDVIVAAVHGAQARAAEMIQQEMKRAAADLGLPPDTLP